MRATHIAKPTGDFDLVDLQKMQPPLSVLWGKHDLSFDPGEPEGYSKDVPNAQVHVLEAGHFALDTAADEIAALMGGFVASLSQ